MFQVIIDELIHEVTSIFMAILGERTKTLVRLLPGLDHGVKRDEGTRLAIANKLKALSPMTS